MGMNSITVGIAPVRGRIRLAKPLAALRSAYFADYPYLRAPGERAALDEMRRLCLDPEVLIVTAHHDGVLVGSIIVGPIAEADTARHGDWFERNGLDRSRWMHALYTLTVPAYRALGVNAAMGDLLNGELVRRGIEGRIAMVIQRQENDPNAPAGWRDPVGFFLTRGYEHTGIAALTVSWADIGDNEPTPKRYIFMVKRTRSDA